MSPVPARGSETSSDSRRSNALSNAPSMTSRSRSPTREDMPAIRDLLASLGSAVAGLAEEQRQTRQRLSVVEEIRSGSTSSMRTGREGAELDSGNAVIGDLGVGPQMFQIGEGEGEELRDFRLEGFALEDWEQLPLRLEDVPQEMVDSRLIVGPGSSDPVHSRDLEVQQGPLQSRGAARSVAVGAGSRSRGAARSVAVGTGSRSRGAARSAAVGTGSRSRGAARTFAFGPGSRSRGAANSEVLRRRKHSTQVRGPEIPQGPLPSAQVRGLEASQGLLPTAQVRGLEVQKNRLPSAQVSGFEAQCGHLPAAHMRGSEVQPGFLHSAQVQGLEAQFIPLPSAQVRGLGDTGYQSDPHGAF